MSKTYTCPRHNQIIGCADRESGCAGCLAEYTGDPALMTPDERAAQMEHLYMPLTVPFDVLHKRIEELVGRPVWTHELGLCKDALIAECRVRSGALSMDQVMEPMLRTEKPVVTATFDAVRHSRRKARKGKK